MSTQKQAMAAVYIDRAGELATQGVVRPKPVTAESIRFARAERAMRRGRRLVMSGFVVAVAGIVLYCVACLSAGANPEIGARLLENPELLIAPSLATIGLGTLLWLVGSFTFLSGAMESDPKNPDLNF